WFELLVTASYLGVATGLIEALYRRPRYSADERMRAVVELETSAAALRGMAADMERLAEPDAKPDDGERVVAHLLMVRYGIQEAISRAVSQAAELMGGIRFVTDPEVEYRLAAVRALAFHPPSKLSVGSALDAYISGESLQLV
ncbi:MAG: acyl-CoA dehydrogenase, partial [Myxococcota bacterium]